MTAGPKPPPGGLVSTFRVRVVMSAQARTKVPAESATTRPPQEFETESPGADSRVGGPQEPPAGSFEAYSAMREGVCDCFSSVKEWSKGVMDNESIRNLLHLNDDDLRKWSSIRKKQKLQPCYTVPDHELEYFDFEQKCSECISGNVRI